MQKRPLFSIFLVVFVDLLGFGLILPLLPYYAREFGAGEALIGLLVAAAPAAQLLGAPLLGRLSDRFGRRPLLMWSILGTCAGFVVLGLANTLWLLFVGRIIDGLTGGNITVAQAYITDVTDERNRARGFGLIGAAFGLGFMIGPAMGGLLSKWGYAVPAFAAAGLALANWIAVYFWLPESLSQERRSELARTADLRADLATYRGLFSRPRTGPLLGIGFVYRLAFSTHTTIFSLYCLVRFDATARATGLMLTYIAFLVVLVQGGAIGPLTRRFTEPRLVLVALAGMTLSLLGWAFAPSIPVLLVVLAPLALSAGVLNTVLQSLLSKSVDAEDTGAVMGMMASLESVSRMAAPALGGWLLGVVGTSAPGVFGALLLVGLFPYVLLFFRSWIPVPRSRGVH